MLKSNSIDKKVYFKSDDYKVHVYFIVFKYAYVWVCME